MSLFNVDITNTGTFSDQTENHGVIKNGIFEDSALNLGTIQLTANFSSNSINQGTVQSTSIFSGSAINYGVTKTTTFSGNSINMGTVSGNAYFTEYSKNSGTVIGHALFAPNATNVGVVSGRIGLYPPIDGHNSTGYYQSGIELMSYVQPKPQLAIDNNLYYTYLSGDTFLANGAYSNYFINISGLIDETKNTVTPQSALDNGIFYLYNNGNAISFASGSYSNYYFSASGIINYAYTNTYPQTAIDNELYYTYTNGKSIIGTGRYNTFYLSAGIIDITYTNTYPQTAINDGLYYTYLSGIALLSEGAYSNFYLSAGIIDITYTNTYPQTAINDGLYYTYLSGIALSSIDPAEFLNGAYSDGYYYNNLILDSYTNTTPQSALDNNLYYTYVSGYSLSTINGAYSNYYLNNLQIDNSYTNNIPQTAINDISTYYTYSSGIASLAEGPYSTHYFVSGSISATYTNITPQTATDNGIYYTYNNGVPVQRSFTLLSENNRTENTFYCDGPLEVGKTLYIDLELTNPTTALIGWYGYINNDNVIDNIWTALDNTGGIEEIRYGTSITLSGTTYYYISSFAYLNNLINLYTDTAMLIPASGLDIIADFNNDSVNDRLVTDEFGAITLTTSSELSGIRYYYSANDQYINDYTQLFTDFELLTPASGLDIIGDFNNDSVQEQLTTDIDGYVTINIL